MFSLEACLHGDAGMSVKAVPCVKCSLMEPLAWLQAFSLNIKLVEMDVFTVQHSLTGKVRKVGTEVVILTKLKEHIQRHPTEITLWPEHPCGPGIGDQTCPLRHVCY